MRRIIRGDWVERKAEKEKLLSMEAALVKVQDDIRKSKDDAAAKA